VKVTTRRDHRMQAQPRPRRSLMTYVRNGKLAALALLIGAGWLLYATLTSPRYIVQHVQLQGGEALTDADVQKLAMVQGQPIWYVRAEEIEARIKQSPYVEQASARVLLPATVVVRVAERQPAMRWQVGDTVYDVTQDGRILAAVDVPPNAPATPITDTTGMTGTTTISPTATLTPTPTLEGTGSVVVVDTTPNRALRPGDQVDPDALEVARRVTLRVQELPVAIERITWQQDLGVVLELGGRTVVLGKSERLDEKMAILAQMLRDNTPFSFLDLRPSTPYYR
jgi:cell division protein FtsQ